MSKIQGFLTRLLSIIPFRCPSEHKTKSSDFTRNRKLPFRKLIVFVYHLVGKGHTEGVDTELGQFFKNAQRSGLWSKITAATRGAFSKRRKQVPADVFQEIHQQALQTGLELWPQRPDDTWKGFSVYAVDGSKFTLPASDELRRVFDPDSGLDHPGKGHYPQCLVSTLYDVFRRLPVARTIVPLGGNEREEALRLLPQVPAGGLVIYDRGYPSYPMLHAHLIDTPTPFVMRCPASQTFPAVVDFMASGKAEDWIVIAPSRKAREQMAVPPGQELPLLPIRVIRMENGEGEPSVLLTNLSDPERFPRKDITTLYYRRWAIETYYREEKIVLDVESFHSRTENGIRQELVAAMTVTLMARVIAAFSETVQNMEPRQIQAKNAVIALAQEAALLAPDYPHKTLEIFRALIQEMSRVKYYPPKKDRPPQPRITKKNHNKWITNRKHPAPS